MMVGGGGLGPREANGKTHALTTMAILRHGRIFACFSREEKIQLYGQGREGALVPARKGRCIYYMGETEKAHLYVQGRKENL
jgi:hypothetical protein